MIRAASATAIALVLAACSTTETTELTRWSEPVGASPAASAAAGPTIDNNPISLAWRGGPAGAARDASGAAYTAIGSTRQARKQAGAVAAGLAVQEVDEATLAGADPSMTVPVNDRYEIMNRGFHDFNQTLDIVVVAPISEVYGALTPRFVQQGVHNGLRNLDEPRNFFNFVFQGNGLKARNSFVRFLVNSTIGLAGLIDVAGRAGIEYEPTDFGMTLARAGVPEGPYLVIPGLGPTTRRDSWASFVDLAFSPPFWVGMTVEGTASDALTISTISGFALDTRYRNADLIDSVIYASPDSYTTMQSIYLQRRRARIRGDFTDTDDEFLPVIP